MSLHIFLFSDNKWSNCQYFELWSRSEDFLWSTAWTLSANYR